MLKQENYQRMTIDRRDNGVVVVTLNRPEKMNAIDNRMHHEMMTFSRDFDDDPDLRVLVLAGAGKAFCVGGDFSADTGIEMPSLAEGRRIVDHMLECEKPIISAVNGYALGLGANLALLCDIVVAGPDAKFGDTHVNMGLGAGDGGQLIWPFLIGVNRAKYHLMTGEMVNGADAYEMGLAGFYADTSEGVMTKAMEIADRLAEGAPLAIAASKVGINAFLRQVAAAVMPISLQAEGLTMNSEDFQEAVAAFQEKRKAEFKGK
ncbi:MAG: enoyl-CoA hydratase-related protein [Alphaproteobacteria bacterium]|nr:enoyl-CoA hydratase-related protein [Alphaproteobacteria bacterium]